jgi:hypothetical protein
MEGVNLNDAWYINVWNTKVKPPWTIKTYIKNEVQESKTSPVQERVPVRGERVNREVEEGGQIRLMYFVFMNKNWTMKPVEIVLWRGRGNEGWWWRGWF